MPEVGEKGAMMILADANSIQKFLDSISIYWAGLGVALLVMTAVISFLRTWYWGRDDPADADDQMVRELEELKRRGDLSEEEFRSIKGRISRRRIQADSRKTGSPANAADSPPGQTMQNMS